MSSDLRLFLFSLSNSHTFEAEGNLQLVLKVMKFRLFQTNTNQCRYVQGQGLTFECSKGAEHQKLNTPATQNILLLFQGTRM